MEREFRRIVSEKMRGNRLDHYLIISGIGVSRNRVVKLIAAGNILVNQKRQKPSYRVKTGDAIIAKFYIANEIEIEPEPMDLNIVFEDEELIVINKPSGVIVHPARGNASHTLVNGLLYHCRLPKNPDSKIRPGVIHRLDKDTTGLLVFAKTDFALTFLSKQIEARKITREYLAIAWGDFPLSSGTIEAPIGRSTLDRKKMAVTPFASRQAVTSYTVLERFEFATYLKLKLLTGRTHQIRVHMLHYGHPIVGDADYGGRSRSLITNRQQEKQFKEILARIARQALHAAILGFIHPKTGKYLEFNSSLPSDINDVLTYLQNSKGEMANQKLKV